MHGRNNRKDRNSDPPLHASRRSFALTIVLLSTMLIASPARADRWAQRAKELSKLRTDVEAIEGKIAQERAAGTAELKALTQQKGELALLLRKEQLTSTSLKKQRLRLAFRLESTQGKRRALVPVVAAAARSLRKQIAASLPFAHAPRLAAIDRIITGLKTRTLAPRSAAGQLWQLLEDELKLCRESSLHQQAIQLDGKRFLADVAHLGMIALYFRISDGRVGHTRRGVKGYRYEIVTGQARNGVIALFKALKKQIRSGLFELPLNAPRPKEASLKATR